MTTAMSLPIGSELERARLEARERRLRLVMQILAARQGEHDRADGSAPAGLRQSIVDSGTQLKAVHQRQAALRRTREPWAPPDLPAGAPPRAAGSRRLRSR
jgi:hypothetical protein